MTVLNLLNVIALDRQQIVSICIGVLLCVVIAVYVACSVRERKRRKKDETSQEPEKILLEKEIAQTSVDDAQPQLVDEVADQNQIETEQQQTDQQATANEDEIADQPVDENLDDNIVADEIDDDDEQLSDDELDELAVADDDNAEDVEEEVTVQLDDNGGEDIVVRRIRYNRSFLARITQASDEVKAWYSQLKNDLLSYSKVKSALSWKHESFRIGRNTFACFVMRGKKICLRFATDPKRFDDTKYKVIDMSIRSPKSKQPCMYRITSDRKVKFAKEIIAMLVSELSVERLADYAAQNYVMPYRTTEALIEDDLIRVKIIEGVDNTETKVDDIDELKDIIKQTEALPKRDFKILKKVEATEVDVMSDAEAAKIIEHKVVKRKKSKGSKGIINIDVLSKKFTAGSVINIDVLRERRIIPNNVNYIKVLANGVLDKPLIVEADDFSLQAVKMIALTGGRVITTDKD